jgi:hypothetical protein
MFKLAPARLRGQTYFQVYWASVSPPDQSSIHANSGRHALDARSEWIFLSDVASFIARNGKATSISFFR